MHINRIGAISIIAISCFLWFDSFVPSHAASPQWEKTEIDRLKIVVSHPNFNESHNTWSAEYDGSWNAIEQLTYENGSKWLTAEYRYITRPYTYLYPFKLKERFEWFNSSDQNLTIVDKGKTEGLLGDYRYMLYSVTKNGSKWTDCVGVWHQWQRASHHTTNPTHSQRAYKKAVTAVFCDSNSSFSVLKSSEMQKLISSVGVKKHRLPTLTSMPKDNKTNSTNKPKPSKSTYCKTKNDYAYTTLNGGCGSFNKEITKSEYDRLKSKKTSRDTNKLRSPEASSLKSKLKELKNLVDEGLITEEEAAAKRTKLLEDL